MATRSAGARSTGCSSGTRAPPTRSRASGSREAYIESRLIRLNNQRAGDKRKSGAEAGPEGSITKLQQAEFNQRLQKLALDLEGVGRRRVGGREPVEDAARRAPRSQVDGDASVAFGFLRAQANTIEGGTSDIMRNILGERVLGLPKEPDNSRELPWSEVPRSGLSRVERDGDGLRASARGSTLEQFLLERGATPEEIDAAEAEGWLTLLAIDRLAGPGPAASTTRAEVSSAAGVDPR